MLREQEREKEFKRKEFESRVKGSPAIVDNQKSLNQKVQERVEAKKRDMKQTEENYKKMLEEMNDKVRKRLLLVENYEEGSRKAKLRDLKKRQKMS